MIKRSLFTTVVLFLTFVAFQYFYSGSLEKRFYTRNGFEIVAHRGVSQTFSPDNIDSQTCTASRIYKPRHQYLENTIESIQAAFDFGATIVEIDIRPTKDNRLVVFHDDTLDCRTNAHGNVWDYTVSELKKFDAGYGYTFDGGKTYPFRGKGIGKIPTLGEVLSQFQDRKFLIDNKSGDNLEVAGLLVRSLSMLPAEQQKNIFLWSKDNAFAYVNAKLPNVKRLLLPRHHQKEFFKTYLLSFGMADVGAEYRDQGLGLPMKYVKFLWGWPNRFLNKVYDSSARFYLFINDAQELENVSGIPLDGIITDNIDLIGRRLRTRNNQIQPTQNPRG